MDTTMVMVYDPADGDGVAGSARNASRSSKKRSYITSRHTEIAGSNGVSGRVQNGGALAASSEFC